MRLRLRLAAGVLLLSSVGAAAQNIPPPGLGSEELGMTHRELVESILKVEQLIQQCMTGQGFQYFAADYETVRAGMNADKRMPGMSEEEFIQTYGFGVSTLYTGRPPQLSSGYSPAKVGLGEQNVEIFRSLSEADKVAYNRSLLGENHGVTFAVALETENLSQTGGCTREAVERVFRPDQLKTTFYNPQDALINNDPRMKAALREFAAKMREAGFEYNHPDEVEPDIKTRLAALTSNFTVLLEALSPTQKAGLERLQDLERRVALKTYQLQETILAPVEEKIQQELFPRKVQ